MSKHDQSWNSCRRRSSALQLTSGDPFCAFRYTLFQQRKPGVQNQWSEKLPDFVKRLEQALFNEAKTKASLPACAVVDSGQQGCQCLFSVVQEDYSNFETLESRLQHVARGLVVRTPQPGSASAAKAGPSQLNNGSYNQSPVEQPQPAQQSAVQADGVSNPQLMLPNAYSGAPSMQPSMGMIPTPGSGIGNSSGMVPVKHEPGVGPNSNTLPNGMIPVDTGNAALAGKNYQQPNGMIPVQGMMGHNHMSSTLMGNGAPVLLKQDNWANPSHSPSMIPVSFYSCTTPVVVPL